MKRASSHLPGPKRVFSRRLTMLGGAMAGMVSTLAGRMYYLKVTYGATIATDAEWWLT